jgi:hypothetical protein
MYKGTEIVTPSNALVYLMYKVTKIMNNSSIKALK